MQKITFLSCVIILLTLASCEKQTSTANYQTIPLPQQIELKGDTNFKLDNSTTIVYPQGDEDLKRVASFLSEYLNFTTGYKLKVSDKEQTNNAIVLKTGFVNENKEAYNLQVNEKQIVIDGTSAAGTFYGVQTLSKSVDANSDGKLVLFPAVNIIDYPRFGYRGMMLDVARHFSTVEFVKTYIDLLALHNMNTFHWHLTDDQGWRIEIKKYPKLVEFGAQRNETLLGRNSNLFDKKPYGEGLYYTQEQIKEIVAYAQERFITVIPEIDLPGHMLGALKAYPELGCTGGPYEVGTKWGVFDDVLCIGNDASMTFLEDVFTEVIALFPSKYIHIGGDECPKTKWESCPKCQAKIKALKLKADANHSAEDRLQSYCMTTVEKFLNSQGKQIIGWDEILEGGLAPNATVMSWRGIAGGIAAAKQGHDVIMTPSAHVYLDYYQTRDVDAPNTQLSIGNYTPLDRVYSYEPSSDELTEEENKHILGVQANLWSECLPTSKNIEYMLMPRLDAVSEVQWCVTKKDYQAFLTRLPNMFKYYDKKGYNYSKTIFDVVAKQKSDANKKLVEVTLSAFDDAPIHYTLDGSEPNAKSVKYTKALEVKENSTLKAIAIREKHSSPVLIRDFSFSKSTFMPITTLSKATGGTADILLDGINGNRYAFGDGSWVGFKDEKVETIAPTEFVIDLGKMQNISSVKVGTYLRPSDSLFGIIGLSILVSDDGKTYKETAKESYGELTSEEAFKHGRIDQTVKFDATDARYIKVLIDKTRQIPSWHRYEGRLPFIYIDEIQVD